MRQFYLLLLAICIYAGTAFAQTYPLVTIQDIQEVPVDSLGTTTTGDLSPYLNDTVTVRGVVVSQPGVAESTSTNGRWIWIQDGNGPWSGLNVRGTGNITTPDDMLNVVPGDSVEITGFVNEYQNESQITPLDNGGFTILTGVSGLRPVLIQSFANLDDFVLNNPPIPSSPDGEPLEGTFVELVNLEVVGVTATATRCNFTVKDVNNNEINIYDTYSVMRPSPSGSSGIIPYPNFNPPVIGDIFDTLRGIVDGRNNATPPYSMAPFDTTHIVYGPSSPKITNVFRDIQVPTDAQQVTITATIADNGGMIVGTPQLFYAFGETNTNYTPVGMTFTGVNNQYTAVIPAGTDGQMVKFYLQATDNDGNITAAPTSTPNDKKYFYFVRNTGKLSIRDIQYTPYPDGQSGYLGETVTVEGVVTGSISDNDSRDFVHIQDIGATEWGGIRLTGSQTVANFISTPKGELVSVTGLVEEEFDFTQLEITDNNGFQILASVGTPSSVDVDPGDFAAYDPAFEKYEGMLVRLSPASSNDSLYVLETSADGSSDFGEYRIGRDVLNPTNGCRVIVGTFRTANFNVSYTSPNAPLDNDYSANRIIVNQGDRMNGVTGHMYFGFGNFKLAPRSNSDFENYEGGTPVTSVDKNMVNDRTVQIYPNPTKSELNFVQSFEDKTYNLSIYNLMGQEVWNARTQSKVSTYDLSKLIDGQYILRVTDKGKFVESFQLIINQ